MIDDSVLRGMAERLWKEAAATHREVHGCEHFEGHEPSRLAWLEAARLYGKIEKKLGTSMAILLCKANEADGGGYTLPSDPFQKAFGSTLVYMASGAGISWSDDHAPFEPLYKDGSDVLDDMLDAGGVEGEIEYEIELECEVDRKYCPSGHLQHRAKIRARCPECGEKIRPKVAPTFEVDDELEGPAVWASALVNGDFSGLDDEDGRLCVKWVDALSAEGWSIVSTRGRTFFSRGFQAFGYDFDQGDMIRYVAHKHHCTEHEACRSNLETARQCLIARLAEEHEKGKATS